MTKINIDEKNKNGNRIQTLTCKGELEILGKINKKKTFNNLYYDQKDEVLEAITKFRNDIMYPDSIGMDNKLGILLYGPPGTGKTGTISACANILNRDVIIIDFSVIKTCQQLDNILKPDNFDKYIYVFDEFDCILDVLINNEKKETNIEKEPEQDWSKILMVAEGEERKQILDMMKGGKSKIKNKE
jgi:mitochondrial chaperone BCS1